MRTDWEMARLAFATRADIRGDGVRERMAVILADASTFGDLGARLVFGENTGVAIVANERQFLAKKRDLVLKRLDGCLLARLSELGKSAHFAASTSSKLR